MTQEEIIEMAREAGIIHPEMVDKHLVAFANLVAAKEREACAKVCEEEGLLWGRRYATAIRARGQA